MPRRIITCNKTINISNEVKGRKMKRETNFKWGVKKKQKQEKDKKESRDVGEMLADSRGDKFRQTLKSLPESEEWLPFRFTSFQNPRGRRHGDSSGFGRQSEPFFFSSCNCPSTFPFFSGYESCSKGGITQTIYPPCHAIDDKSRMSGEMWVEPTV